MRPADAYVAAVEADKATRTDRHADCVDEPGECGLEFCGQDNRPIVWGTRRPFCMMIEMARRGMRWLGIVAPVDWQGPPCPDDMTEPT